jgi:hypothetical protein
LLGTTTQTLKRRFRHKNQSGNGQIRKGVVPPIKWLSELRRVALRRRVWFRALNQIERSVLDLTMRYVDNIKSAKLAKVVTAILNKLQATLVGFIDRKVRTIGRSMAEKMSTIAVSWGNKSAHGWRWDQNYARYLALCFSFKEIGT